MKEWVKETTSGIDAFCNYFYFLQLSSFPSRTSLQSREPGPGRFSVKREEPTRRVNSNGSREVLQRLVVLFGIQAMKPLWSILRSRKQAKINKCWSKHWWGEKGRGDGLYGVLISLFSSCYSHCDIVTPLRWSDLHWITNETLSFVSDTRNQSHKTRTAVPTRSIKHRKDVFHLGWMPSRTWRYCWDATNNCVGLTEFSKLASFVSQKIKDLHWLHDSKTTSESEKWDLLPPRFSCNAHAR